MELLGLTGGIASGKSTVSAMLRQLGAIIIDADAVYHDLIAPRDGRPSALAQQVGAAFPGVLQADGSIDRRELGGRVFGNPAALAELGAITHPAVAAEFARRVASLRAAGVQRVIYDVPLLFERRLQEGMHGVIVVWVPRPVQLERLVARDGISRSEADRRLAAQMPLDEKRRRATWVIDNSGSRDATHRQVEELWAKLDADLSPAPHAP